MTARLDARAPTGQLSRVPQMPGLDGMRALAVVAVMVYHANSAWLHGGFLGVEVFFVISGYLITLLLIAEHERTGHVDLKAFWIRRFRRLLPALFVMLALLMVYVALFYRDAQGRTRGDIVGGVSYLSNWYQIWVGAGYTAAEAFAPLRHLWSLAVEEQFYLLWPLVMVLFLRRGQARLPRVGLWLFGVAVFITVAVAVLYVPGDIPSVCSAESMRGYWEVAGRCISINDTLYLGTFSRAGGLMLGAAFAMVWRPIAIMRGPLQHKAKQLDLLAVVGLFILAVQVWFVHLVDPALTMLTGSRFDPWLFRGGFFVTGIATVMMIAAVTHPRSAFGTALGNPLFSWIGTRSYGLYLYHWPIYQIIRKEAGQPLTVTQFVMAMALTVVLTEASYRFIEMPVRRGVIGAWFNRDRRSRAGMESRQKVVLGSVVVAAVLGVAGISIAMAPNQCLGDVECSLAEADAANTNTLPSTPPSSEVGGTDTTLAPDGVTTVPTTLAPTTTTTIPFAERPPIAVGESVMKGATAQLQTGGFTVYAEENKGPNWITETVAQLRASSQIGETIVIQLGTNGPVSAEQYAELMALLPAEEVPQVILLTVKAPRDWIGPNNDIIRSLQGQYTNVTVLDWAGLAPQVESELSTSDGGIHLRTNKAKQFYANYIFDVIGRRDLVLSLDNL